MKVAFISRATLFSAPGGDTRQLEETARHLRLLGVAVDVCLTSQEIDYAQYDLLHFFNITRPADIIRHIRRSGKPYVVSPIFVEYGLVREKSRSKSVQLVQKLLSAHGFEYLKAVARAVKNGEKIMSREYLSWGHKRSVLFVARHAALLLPNSASEARRLKKVWGISNTFHIVPNGIDEEMAMRSYPDAPEYKNSVLCVGRVEHLKNQLGLIRALNNTAFRLLLHGKPGPNSQDYYERCKAEAAGNVELRPFLRDEALYTAYHNAKVHVLPSYFETTGLSSLEAAVMGCNIVVTDRGDTRDYFGDYAWYCDPDDPGSIRAAVQAAYEAPYNPEFRAYILRRYTWRRAAEETFSAYKSVLDQPQTTLPS